MDKSYKEFANRMRESIEHCEVQGFITERVANEIYEVISKIEEEFNEKNKN